MAAEEKVAGKPTTYIHHIPSLRISEILHLIPHTLLWHGE